MDGTGSFIRRLINWWLRNHLTLQLPYHGEAYGLGGMNLIELIDFVYITKRNLQLGFYSDRREQCSKDVDKGDEGCDEHSQQYITI